MDGCRFSLLCNQGFSCGELDRFTLMLSIFLDVLVYRFSDVEDFATAVLLNDSGLLLNGGGGSTSE